MKRNWFFGKTTQRKVTIQFSSMYRHGFKRRNCDCCCLVFDKLELYSDKYLKMTKWNHWNGCDKCTLYWDTLACPQGQKHYNHQGSRNWVSKKLLQVRNSVLLLWRTSTYKRHWVTKIKNLRQIRLDISLLLSRH